MIFGLIHILQRLIKTRFVLILTYLFISYLHKRNIYRFLYLLELIEFLEFLPMLCATPSHTNRFLEKKKDRFLCNIEKKAPIIDSHILSKCEGSVKKNDLCYMP